MVRCCSVPQCRNKYGIKGIGFHRFPKNVELKNVWIQALKIGKEVTGSTRVCSAHFSTDSYVSLEGVKRLKCDVIPNQNLPSSNCKFANTTLIDGKTDCELIIHSEEEKSEVVEQKIAQNENELTKMNHSMVEETNMSFESDDRTTTITLSSDSENSKDGIEYSKEPLSPVVEDISSKSPVSPPDIETSSQVEFTDENQKEISRSSSQIDLNLSKDSVNDVIETLKSNDLKVEKNELGQFISSVSPSSSEFVQEEEYLQPAGKSSSCDNFCTEMNVDVDENSTFSGSGSGRDDVITKNSDINEISNVENKITETAKRDVFDNFHSYAQKEEKDRLLNGLQLMENDKNCDQTISDSTDTKKIIWKKQKIHTSVEANLSGRILEPFQRGWSRELVHRAPVGEEKVSRMADVYYRTPSKMKLRSYREVADYLSTIDTDLTLDCFTFRKILIYHPPEEFERVAHNRLKSSSTNRPTSNLNTTQSSINYSKVNVKVSPHTIKKASPKVKTYKAKVSSKAKFPVKEKAENTKNISTIKKIFTKVNRTPCSINCPGLNGEIPLLNCSSCLCMYHPVCVGWNDCKQSFICDKCKTETNIIGSKKRIMKGNDVIPVKKKKLDISYNTESNSPLIAVEAKDDRPERPVIERVIPAANILPRLIAAPSLSKNNTKTNNQISADRPPPPLKAAPFVLRNSIKPIKIVGTWIPPASLPPKNMLLSRQPPPLKKISVMTFLTTDNSSKQKPIQPIPPPPPLKLGPQIQDPVINNSNSPTFIIVTNPPVQPTIAQATESSNTTTSIVIQNKIETSTIQLGVVNSNASPSLIVNVSDTGNSGVNESTIPPKNQTSSENIVTGSVSETNTEPIPISATVEKINLSDDGCESTAEKNVSSQSGGSKTEVRIAKQKKPGINPALCSIQRLLSGVKTLIYVFKYLRQDDLARASCVCQAWKWLASQPELWKYIKLDDICVYDWEVLKVLMRKYKSYRLDMRRMQTFEDHNRTWHGFAAVLQELDTIKHIDFGCVPVSILHTVVKNLTQLEILTAEWITDFSSNICRLDIGIFGKLKDLKKLRLRSVSDLQYLTLSGGFTNLENLTELTHLSITTLRDVPGIEFQFIKALTKIKELELGDCTNWTEETYHYLEGLNELVSLSLECCSYMESFYDIISKLKKLKYLELRNLQGNNNWLIIVNNVRSLGITVKVL